MSLRQSSTDSSNLYRVLSSLLFGYFCWFGSDTIDMAEAFPGSENVCPSGMMAMFNAATCSNDLTCQALATGFFCLRGRCCAHTTPPPGGYGTSCLNDDQCSLQNAQCKRNVCYCRPGFTYNGDDNCIPRVFFDASNSAPLPPPGAIGRPPKCAPGQTLINGNCYGYVGFNGFCDYSRQCNFVNGVCERNRCNCATGQVFNGVACIEDPKTVIRNFEAKSIARAPFRLPTTTGAVQRDSLYTACLPGEVWTDGECAQRRYSGQPCAHDAQCTPFDAAAPRLSCVGGVCQRAAGFAVQPPLAPIVSLETSRRFAAIDRLIAPATLQCDEPRGWRIGGSGNCIVLPPARDVVSCGIGQLRINSVCYPIVGPGEVCAFDAQCRAPSLIFCNNFVCQFSDLRHWSPYPAEFPVCRNPSADVELSSAIPKDCIYQRCSNGFHCEFNALYKGGQYICCGAYPNNPIYGQIKMFPGYGNLPIQCRAINSCTFMDFPFCVFSESHRHRVCCSKPQCL